MLYIDENNHVYTAITYSLKHVTITTTHQTEKVYIISQVKQKLIVIFSIFLL